MGAGSERRVLKHPRNNIFQVNLLGAIFCLKVFARLVAGVAYIEREDLFPVKTLTQVNEKREGK